MIESPLPQSNLSLQLNGQTRQTSVPGYSDSCQQNGQVMTGYSMPQNSQPYQMNNQVGESLFLQVRVFAEQRRRDRTTTTADGHNITMALDHENIPDKYLSTHDISLPMRDDRPRYESQNQSQTSIKWRRRNNRSLSDDSLSLDLNDLVKLKKRVMPILWYGRNSRSSSMAALKYKGNFVYIPKPIQLFSKFHQIFS